MLPILIKLAVLAAIGYVVWRMVRPRHAVKIVMDEDGVRQHEGLSKGQESKVLDFLHEHVSPHGKLTIYADRQRNGYLRLDIRGPVDAGTRQQIRNFLITVM